MTEETETSNKPQAGKPQTVKPAAPAPKPKKSAVGGFGDAPLGGTLVDPVSFDKRDRTGGRHAIEIAGLVLSPAQLALAMTVLPLASGTKPGLVAMLGGLVVGALFCILLQAPLLRYGIPLGVLARASFGTRGAKLFSAVRLLVQTTFFGSGVYLAAQTLFWCVLCSMPSTVALVQRVPLVDGTSLIVVLLSLLIAIPLWLVSTAPKARTMLILLIPSLLLALLLFLLPDNLPMGTAWGMLDVADRVANTDVFPIFLISFAWSMAIYMTPASEVRRETTQIGQTLAVAGAGVLPWLLGSMAMALAVLSSGQNQGGFFDVPSLACRRLGAGLLVPVLGAASIAYIWPTAHVTKQAALLAVQEMLGARAGKGLQRVVELLFLVLGVSIAILSRTSVSSLLFVTVAVQIAVVAAYLVMLAQYFMVDRTHLVLDDFYTVLGSYRGVLGVLPAGFMSLAAGYAAYWWTGRTGMTVAMSAGIGLATAGLAQALFGNVQRLVTRRRA